MKLFINYRREDTDDLAGRIHDRLSSEFGTENIFKDVDSIRPGQNWKAILEQAVGNCDIVLALIGKNWTKCVDRKGQPRLLSEEDWVRFELEAANRTRRVIMPILVKGTPVPAIEELPESLRWLLEIHVSEIRGDPFFKDDVARLVNELRRMRDRLTEQEQARARAQISPAVGGDTGRASIVCPVCKRLCPRTDQFCEACGGSLWDICPRCSTPIPTAQRFCNTCGADFPKAKQADEAYAMARADLSSLGLNKDPAERLRRADLLLGEVETALRLMPDHRLLSDLRRQVRELALDSAREAAATEFAGARFGRSLHYFRQLELRGDASEETIARIRYINEHREQQLGEAAAVMARGGYKQGATILEQLHLAFPDDSRVKESLETCRQVLDRATSLLSCGLRELRAQRRLIEMEREISWLQARNIRAERLPGLAAATREKIAAADATVAKAASELRAGNVKGACRMARTVLDTIADHERAMQIAEMSGGVAEKVAQLEEYVELKRWCAAHVLVRELEEKHVSDPGLPRLSARTKAAIADIDFRIRLFAVMLAAAIVGWYFVVPWVVSAIPAPSGAGDRFFHHVWFGASGLVLALTWWVFDDKSQIMRRVASAFRRKASRSTDMSDSQFASIRSPDRAVDPVSVSSILQAVAESRPSAEVLDLPVIPTEAPPDVRRPPGAEAPPPPLNATESLQRVESTAIFAEWVLFGGAAFWLAWNVARWLVRGYLEAGWWDMPMGFALVAFAVIPAALFAGRFSGWRVDLASAVVGTLLVLAMSVAVSFRWSALTAFSLYPIYLGVISGSVNRIPLRRGVGTTLGGPVGGLLLASPIILLFSVLINVIGPPEAWVSVPSQNPLVTRMASAAVIWCTLVASGSTASETLIRYFVMDRPLVRGVFAFGLVFATAAAVVCFVTILALFLNEKSLWITGWILFFAASQLVPPLLRWQWRPWFSMFGAVLSLTTIAAVVFMEWLSPLSSLAVAAWVVFCSAPVLLCVRTVDIFTHRDDVFSRLRLRMRSRRLPVRINVTRR